jgi:hypothetical protein
MMASLVGKAESDESVVRELRLVGMNDRKAGQELIIFMSSSLDVL